MSEARKRGRPAHETPEAKLARLKKEIIEAEAAVREADKEKYSIVGEAVLAAARTDPDLKAKLREVLPQHVKSARAKEAVAPLLAA